MNMVGTRIILGALFLGILTLPFADLTLAEPSLKGEYERIDQPSRHQPGKVILFEFADFYCPHCHMFERVVASKLKQAFGDRLEIRLVGFPVIQGKLPTAFEMYEQAVTMGKGPEMKAALFRAIHEQGIQMFDKSMRALLIKEVGLDPVEFEAGLASGKPYRQLQKGKAWGEAIGVTHTPTIVLDGNIRVANLTFDNLKTVIQSILDQDRTS